MEYPYTHPKSFVLYYPEVIKLLLTAEENDATIVPSADGKEYHMQAKTQKSFWLLDWIRTRIQGIDEGIRLGNLLNQYGSVDIPFLLRWIDEDRSTR